MRALPNLLLTAFLALPAAADERIGVDELQSHVGALADDGMAGRLAGSPGERAAAHYVAAQFRAAGLLPAGDVGYMATFSFASGVTLGAGNRLDLFVGDDTRSPTVLTEWRPLEFSRPGNVAPAGVVFAGYGLIAENGSGYNSYAGLDVRGKWVLVWRGVPVEAPLSTRAALSQYADLRFKTAIAAAHGAVGLIVAPAPDVTYADDLPTERFEASLGQAGVPAVAIDRATAAALLASLGPGFEDLARRLARGDPAGGAPLHAVRASAEIDLSVSQATGRNVLARLGVGTPGAPPLVIGAHLDHLGRGETGTSLAMGAEVGEIHRGADDNASGVAALIEIAEALAARRDAGHLPAVRDILIAAWSGEEIGLLGSRDFVERAGGAAPAAAYLNIDMIGRLRDTLTMAGYGSSPAWPETIAGAASPGLPFEQVQSPYVPTDAMSFYLAGVPVLSFTTGPHSDYHTPRDLPDRLNYQGMERIAGVIEEIAVSLATRTPAPKSRAVAAAPGPSGRKRAAVTLGTIPDYGATLARGVPIAGTVEGGPAAAAGLRRGDVIVGLAGVELNDIYAFMMVITQLRPGDPVEIEILREDARQTRRIVPSARPGR